MGAREDAAYEKLAATITTIKEGWAAKDAEIRVLREQLAAADEATQVAVAAALEADSEVDAAKVEAADAALRELIDVAPEPEPGDDESGDGEEPVGEEPVDDEPVDDEPVDES